MSVAICFPICSTQLNLKALLSTFHLDFGNFEILLEIFSNFKKMRRPYSRFNAFMSCFWPAFHIESLALAKKNPFR